MDPAECEEMLSRALVGRVGTVGSGGMPYILPMNFFYDASSRTVILHHTTTGHLLDNLAQSASACFEVDELGAVVASGTRACDTGQLYRSVVCFGWARVAEDEVEKRDALHALVRKYIDELTPDREYNPELVGVEKITVIALKVEVMTGKKRI